MSRTVAADLESVDPKRAAELLGISRDTVMDAINGKELPWWNAGSEGKNRRYRIRIRDLDRWMQSRTTAA
jgi:excisionase family DNA binding protein